MNTKKNSISGKTVLGRMHVKLFMLTLLSCLVFSCEADDYPFLVNNAEYNPDGAELNGLRWELPYGAGDPAPVTAVFQGRTGKEYSVSLRFRGVVEQRAYTGGTDDGAYWQVGGDTPGTGDVFNIYKLEISSPPQVFYLNKGTSGISRVWAIDYTKRIVISGGATITLTAQTIDTAIIDNTDGSGNRVYVPDVPPYPEAFPGQFIQMDVVSVREVN